VRSTPLASSAMRTVPGRIERIAIVNRGEAALRLISAVRELNEERAGRIRTIALFTDPERHALFVREADEAVSLGDAVVHVADGTSHSAYVDLDVLGRALAEARADAAWVGWGGVAEDPAFAQRCAGLGVTFVGPNLDTLRLLGDPVALQTLAGDCGIPVQEGSEDVGALDGRLLEVQVVADAAGTVWVLGVRDASVQHRGEKMLEESAAPTLTGDQQRRLQDDARGLCER